MGRVYAVICWIIEPTNLTAIATLVLAMATAGLAVLGYCQIRLARIEYKASHRPHIIVRDVFVEGVNIISYLLINKGEGQVVQIVESVIRVDSIPNDQVVRPLHSVGINDLGPISLNVGEVKILQFPMPSEFGFATRHPNAARIGINDTPPFNGQWHFTGTIVYIDGNEFQRRTVFRRVWDQDSGSFERHTNSDLEYAD